VPQRPSPPPRPGNDMNALNHAGDLAGEIRSRLAALAPAQLELLDESGRHVGHAGARDGGSHFHLTIVSSRFDDLPRIARHRLVYAALDGLFPGRIHALAIDARTPGEPGAL